MSWDQKFSQPIVIPGRRQRLVTLRDAVLYMTSLPRAEQNAEHWRPAATLLGIVAENGGCLVFARLAVMYGLRKGVQSGPPGPDPAKKTTHWGAKTEAGFLTGPERMRRAPLESEVLPAELATSKKCHERR